MEAAVFWLFAKPSAADMGLIVVAVVSIFSVALFAWRMKAVTDFAQKAIEHNRHITELFHTDRVSALKKITQDPKPLKKPVSIPMQAKVPRGMRPSNGRS